jgi:hypothetical protein
LGSRPRHIVFIAAAAIGLCLVTQPSLRAKDYPLVPKSEHSVFGQQLLEIDPPTETEGGYISPDGTRIASENYFASQRDIYQACAKAAV